MDLLVSPISILVVVLVLGTGFGLIMRWCAKPPRAASVYCIEIIAGMGKGQVRLILDPGPEGDQEVLTIDRPWDPPPDATSIYSVYAMRV